MPLSIKELPAADRPRERLVLSGVGALSDAELVALVFGGDLPAASRVVAAVGGSSSLARAGAAELCEVPGVGPARASQLLAAIELGRRSADVVVDPRVPVRTPIAARDHLSDLARLEQEELHVLALDGRHRLIARFAAARGALNVVHVSPRDVYRRLLREGAAACIVAHNHPSGDPSPSPDDGELTQRLRAAGDLVGIAMLDHLVIANEGFYSFAEERLVQATAGRRGGGNVDR